MGPAVQRLCHGMLPIMCSTSTEHRPDAINSTGQARPTIASVDIRILSITGIVVI